MVLTLDSDFGSDLLKLIYQNTNIALIGDATGLRGSSAAGSFYLALHTANPGAGGAQNTSEAAYTSYTRIAVARSGSGFTVTGLAVSNAAQVDFVKATGGSETLTHVSLGTALSGTGYVLCVLELDNPIAVTTNTQPAFAAGDLVWNVGGA